MRIDDFTMEHADDRRRIQAEVNWEDVDRPPYQLYFEVDREFEDALCLSAHPFLVGCLVPALHFGERRIRVAGDVCPELLENLEEAWRILVNWYTPGEQRSFAIEEDGVLSEPLHSRRRSNGVFFSGGIDSFTALRLNRLLYAESHPRSFNEGILVYGLEQDDPGVFEIVRRSLEEAARETGLRLLTVYTNIYLQFRAEDEISRFALWKYKMGGAALAAVGHALSARLSGVTIAATHDLTNLEPWGSHPMLDHYYGSTDMLVRQAAFSLTRPERTRIVADWQPALRHLRVCNKYRTYAPGHLNCGECEKCLRTMLTLLSLGALERTDAFPTKDVSAEMIDRGAKMAKAPQLLIPSYQAILPALEKIGRTDLTEAIEHKIAEVGQNGLRKKVKDIAAAYLEKSV
jgi:hypothetical protein